MDFIWHHFPSVWIPKIFRFHLFLIQNPEGTVPCMYFLYKDSQLTLLSDSETLVLVNTDWGHVAITLKGLGKGGKNYCAYLNLNI